MDLRLPTEGLENYKSASQRARVGTESWCCELFLSRLRITAPSIFAARHRCDRLCLPLMQLSLPTEKPIEAVRFQDCRRRLFRDETRHPRRPNPKSPRLALRPRCLGRSYCASRSPFRFRIICSRKTPTPCPDRSPCRLGRLQHLVG